MRWHSINAPIWSLLRGFWRSAIRARRQLGQVVQLLLLRQLRDRLQARLCPKDLCIHSSVGSILLWSRAHCGRADTPGAVAACQSVAASGRRTGRCDRVKAYSGFFRYGPHGGFTVGAYAIRTFSTLLSAESGHPCGSSSGERVVCDKADGPRAWGSVARCRTASLDADRPTRNSVSVPRAPQTAPQVDSAFVFRMEDRQGYGCWTPLFPRS